MAETAALRSYRGSCQCDSFIYELKVPEIKLGKECDCSMCRKTGCIFTFPGDSYFTIKNESSLTEYTPKERDTIYCVRTSTII